MVRIVMIAALILVMLGFGFYIFNIYLKNQNSIVGQNTQPTNILPVESSASSSPTASNSARPDLSNNALDKKFQDLQGSLNKLDSDQKTSNTDSSFLDTPPVK